MKLATTVLAIATAVAATPSSLPVGVEIFERDGLTSVREVVSLLLNPTINANQECRKLTGPSLTRDSVLRSAATTASTVAAVAPSATATATAPSTPTALGAAPTASPSAFHRAKTAPNGASK